MTGRALGAVAAVLGLVALVTALVLVLTPPRSAAPASVALPSAGRLPSSNPAPAEPPPVRTAVPPGRHATVRLGRLKLDARVVHVRLRGSVMDVPNDPAEVGWWRDGAVPGAARGSAVLVGHVNYQGRSGAFAVLPRVRPGDVVTLTDPGRTYEVDAVRSYAKRDGLPQSIFRRDGPAQLVLITCGGSFDAASGNYRDNVVVYAVPAALTRNG